VVALFVSACCCFELVGRALFLVFSVGVGRLLFDVVGLVPVARMCASVCFGRRPYS